MLAAVDEPVEGEHPRRRGEAVRQPERHGQLGADGARRGQHVTAGPRTGTRARSAAARRRRSGVRRPGVARRSGLPREAAVADEPARPRVADEERRDHEVQLVGEVGGEELGVHRAAALDHQPADAACVEVLAHRAQVDRLTAVDDGGDPAQPRAGPSSTVAGGAVDELVAVAGGEEPAHGVEVGALGDGHLHRRRGTARGPPARPAAGDRGPAAAGRPCGPSPPRPGSRRSRRGPRRPGRSRRRWRAAARSSPGPSR